MLHPVLAHAALEHPHVPRQDRRQHAPLRVVLEHVGCTSGRLRQFGLRRLERRFRRLADRGEVLVGDLLHGPAGGHVGLLGRSLVNAGLNGRAEPERLVARPDHRLPETGDLRPCEVLRGSDPGCLKLADVAPTLRGDLRHE